MKPRYPIYIPSRGRYAHAQAITVRTLQHDQVPFRLVVEPQEADLYRPLLSHRDELLVLEENDYGSSMFARNFIRRHAIDSGAERHWQLDDNILTFMRSWEGYRIPAHSGVSLRVCEDLSDRVTNVGVSGLNYSFFIHPAGGGGRTPFYRNIRVYSCSLINHEMPFEWRLRYNEDTDLCLQALTGGWATLLVNAFLAKKLGTMTVKGGNTDELYDGLTERDTHGRYEMARTLERAWPGTVKVSRRFQRFQHVIDWRGFADVPLVLRPGLDLEALPHADEYGLALRAAKQVRSARIRGLLAEYPRTLKSMTELLDPLWRGMPVYRMPDRPPRLAVKCRTDADRETLEKRLGVTIHRKAAGQDWPCWWPPRERMDPASLRFEWEPTRGRFDPVTQELIT
jgi:hypothetical protein